MASPGKPAGKQPTMTITTPPAINAALNALSAILLLAGFAFIKRGNQTAHRNCMVSAFITSALFLICYLSYHSYRYYVLKQGPTVFRDPSWFRPIYLTILITHTILAAAILPLALVTLAKAVRKNFAGHKKIARVTWPIWMYVSVTGVLIYFLLYQIFPQH